MRSPAKPVPLPVSTGEQPSRGPVRHLQWNVGREEQTGSGVQAEWNVDTSKQNVNRIEQNGNSEELTWADRVRGGRSAGGGGEREAERGGGREVGGGSAVVCSGLPAGQKPEVSTGQWCPWYILLLVYQEGG